MLHLSSSIFPFALASLLIELTPGPNMTYLALVSAGSGRRAGFSTVAGIALGLATVGLVAAFGVSQLIQSSPLAYEMLRWCGIAFLLYLAWEGWTVGTDVVAAGSKTEGRFFLRGLVTNVLNPKSGLFYVSVLPTFIDPAKPASMQAAVLTLTYVAIATAVHAMIVLLAGALAPFLGDPARDVIMRRALSALLAVVAVWFGWSTAR